MPSPLILDWSVVHFMSRRLDSDLHSRGEGASQIARLRTYVFMSLRVFGSRLMPSPGGSPTKLGAPLSVSQL